MTGTLIQSKRRINSQQIAWGVLLLSFAVFCTIVIFIIFGIQYFLFQSRVPMQTTVDASRGTATLIGADLIEQAVRGERQFTDSAVLTTDVQSQATLTFGDSQRNIPLVTSITLKNGSSLNLEENSKPRFTWGSDPYYWIDIGDAYGEFDIFVPDNLDHSILISVETTLGPSVRLTSSGRYTLIAAGAQVQVVNYSGNALLIAPDRRNQPVPAGQSVAMQGDSDQFKVNSTPVNLLGDSSFSANNVLDYNATANQVSQAWRCNNVQPSDEPVGTFNVTTDDGRPALRFFRDNGAESHGESLCVQGLGSGTNGLDVSAFSRVSIRATFKIASQSLSACGAQGSECPFTLAMDYFPTTGTDAVTWHHGFYAFVDPNRIFPLRCDTCTEDHESINPGVWYTYENRNFLESFALDQRPKSILNLRFYASGHQYDVYVNEVSLLVDPAQAPQATPGG